MKRKFPSSHLQIHWTVALLLMSAFAAVRAQDGPPQGAFRFANACATPGKVFLTVDTAKVRPGGFEPGETTAGIGIMTGAHRVSATTEGGKPAEANLMVQPNASTTVVAYTKPVVDPQTKKTVDQLQLFSQPDPPRGKGKHFRLLYVSAARPAVDVTLNGQATRLNALREGKADEVARGQMKIESAGKSVIDFTAEENGSFLVIVFDKADGSLGGMVLPDYG